MLPDRDRRVLLIIALASYAALMMGKECTRFWEIDDFSGTGAILGLCSILLVATSVLSFAMCVASRPLFSDPVPYTRATALINHCVFACAAIGAFISVSMSLSIATPGVAAIIAVIAGRTAMLQLVFLPYANPPPAPAVPTARLIH